jgi:hypothetical protein
MVIELYVCVDERNKLFKTLTDNVIFSGSLRGESSVVNPSFIVETDNPSQYNYCFIPDFNRYYFISNITNIRTNLWRIDCNVDVLMSFQTQIANLDIIAEQSTAPDEESYMQGEMWQSTVKTKTDIINFPNGLLENGEYILITSGGIAGGSNA